MVVCMVMGREWWVYGEESRGTDLADAIKGSSCRRRTK